MLLLFRGFPGFLSRLANTALLGVPMCSPDHISAFHYAMSFSGAKTVTYSSLSHHINGSLEKEKKKKRERERERESGRERFCIDDEFGTVKHKERG